MKRKDIHVATFNKIKEFLEKQPAPIFKVEIVKKLKVDWDSLAFALKMIKHKVSDDGRVSI